MLSRAIHISLFLILLTEVQVYSGSRPPNAVSAARRFPTRSLRVLLTDKKVFTRVGNRGPERRLLQVPLSTTLAICL
ncbi:hypothetical protein OH77DRAFT_893871 [Trametes cingulata]|nr:hypothetical protein OH77DRAFT_893871 [Trametes cingulata]